MTPTVRTCHGLNPSHLSVGRIQLNYSNNEMEDEVTIVEAGQCFLLHWSVFSEYVAK